MTDAALRPMAPLYVELHRWASTPHAWGFDDCMTVICDWCVRCGHPDPMGELRWSYDSAASCQKATGFLLDPVGVATRQFEGVASLRRGNDLRAGDVAVIRRRDDPRWPLGALWLGAAWACKGPTGTTTLRPDMVEVLAFWSVGYDEAAP